MRRFNDNDSPAYEPMRGQRVRIADKRADRKPGAKRQRKAKSLRAHRSASR